MKFPLEWLINIRQDELNQIEMELNEVNNKISRNSFEQASNKEKMNKFQDNLFSCVETSKISSIVRAIESYEEKNKILKEELEYLSKEKEMILNRYNQKNIEVKLLEKTKEKFITKEKYRLNKKEESEINELSLLVGKDD